MASTLRAGVFGINELRADLEAVSIGTGRELTLVIKEGAGLIVEGAQPLTPYDPQHDTTREDKLGHIRDSMYAIALGSGSAVASRHPGGVVHEYGGEIAPNGTPFQIKRSEMAHTAGEAALNAITALLERRISALIGQHFG